MIKKVTITGADDSVRPEDLLSLSKKYPFVEWGILYSTSQAGGPRFPGLQWLDALTLLADAQTDNSFALSAHLCGKVVREFCQTGERSILESAFGTVIQRVQLNFHAIPHAHGSELFKAIKGMPDKQFIFQIDEVNDLLVRLGSDQGCDVAALFDKSGGAGILPDQWPAPYERIPCGYAGGLSPHNVVEQIKLIEAKAGSVPIWIDVETHLRSESNWLFDLGKVDTFLQRTADFVSA